MPNRFDGKSLIQKLAIIQGEVRYVQKNGYNAHHKYKYVREADLVEKLAPMLAEAGIMMVPSVISSAKEGTVTRLTVKYNITDGESSVEAQVVGEGADAQDKGAYKAMTGAHKYLLYKLFNIETGDDPEAEDGPAPKAQPKDAKVALVENVLGGKAFDDKEMVYVRLNECQTEEELKAIGTKVRAQFPNDRKFLEEFAAHWTDKRRELSGSK